MSAPLVLMPLLIFCTAAGLGFAVSALAGITARRRPAPPPPRGFRPVVIEGGKEAAPTQMQDAAP